MKDALTETGPTPARRSRWAGVASDLASFVMVASGRARNMNMAICRRRVGGFTLDDLLVTVAVVALVFLLIGMLLPPSRPRLIYTTRVMCSTT